MGRGSAGRRQGAWSGFPRGRARPATSGRGFTFLLTESVCPDNNKLRKESRVSSSVKTLLSGARREAAFLG